MKIVADQATHTAVAVLVVLHLTSTVAVVFRNFKGLQGSASFVFFVFMSGTIGVIANNYRRLYRVPLAELEQPTVAQRLVTVQIYMSPLIGGIFAVALYVIFMSGIIQGDFFPDFQGVEEAFMDMPHFVDITLPKTNDDAAQALICAFIAGFSEGLVPNFIDKIARASFPSETQQKEV